MAPGSHPASYFLPGVRLIEPATQGDYDGLCGLYCIINAVRLVMAPHRELTLAEVRALFTDGSRFLARQGRLPEAVHSCVHKRDWPKLAQRVVATAQRLADCRILLERPSLSKDATFQDTLRQVEGMVASGKAPCVFFRGTYRHYTVISGYTPVSLKLFDSFGHRWVLRRSCGTKNRAPRHRLHVRSIIAITVPTGSM